jgi:predicted MPP superfamily phosphohydrolase
LNRRFRSVLMLAVALVSLGESLSLQWLWMATTGSALSLVPMIAVLALFWSLNLLILPFARRHLHSGGIAQWLALTWIMASIAALFVGVLLSLFGSVISGGGYVLGNRDATLLTMVWVGGAVIALGVGSVAWGVGVGDRRIRIDRVPLPLRGAAQELGSLRVAHVTDLHIGPLLRPERLRKFVERINRLEADIIVITGDIFDFDPAYIDAGCQELGRLRARCGVFAVTGNHDVYTGVEAVADGVARHTEIRLLRNEWECIDVGGASLVIAGVDDPGEGWTERESEHPELGPLALGIPAGLPTLLLAHRPSFFGHAARLGFSWVLSGHTHGGQVALPRAHHVNLSRMISDHTRGIFHRGETTLYVNRGLGMAGLPLRLNCPREIALVEFVA